MAEELRTLQRELERQAKIMGARFFGVADLTAAQEAIVAQGGQFLAAFPRAISVGIALTDSIVDELPRHKEPVIARTYDYLVYTVINQSLDRIALRVSAALEEQGYRVLPVPTSQRVDQENLWGLFSHKLAAHLAGLGWIGKSCLLITPEVGPRVRWATVLTDALLEAGSPLSERCGDCQRCVEACPSQAITGRPFDPREPRECRLTVHRCEEYRAHLRDQVTGVRTCGMCVYVCPHGRKEALA
ncbi:MAG: 4Fe-4S double cluster binding domain-containing protein [Anaerolineae bacterium]